MKKLLGIVLIGIMLNGNSYGSLFSLKKYAKCEFKSQVKKFKLSLYLDITRKDYFKYFAFDKEYFYYKYNIAEKDFDEKVEHNDGNEPIKHSYRFYIDDNPDPLKIIFDGSIGELKFTTLPNNGSMIYTCDKINKNQLPKSKF